MDLIFVILLIVIFILVGCIALYLIGFIGGKVLEVLDDLFNRWR